MTLRHLNSCPGCHASLRGEATRCERCGYAIDPTDPGIQDLQERVREAVMAWHPEAQRVMLEQRAKLYALAEEHARRKGVTVRSRPTALIR